MKIGILALLFFLLMPSWAQAQRQRIDLFDPQGNRQGYVVIEPKTGRVDMYDKLSNRTGYGYLRPDGRVETFDLNGQRKQQGRWRDGQDR